MILCVCHAVSDADVKALLARGASPEEIARSTGAGTDCGACRDELHELAGGCGSPTPCPGCPRAQVRHAA